MPTAPEMEPGMSREEYNRMALERWDQEALMPCPNCGRTFLPDRLEVHLRGCKPKPSANAAISAGSGGTSAAHSGAPASPKQSLARAPSPSPGTREVLPKPRTVVCYICGREFGSASIEIHRPQCAKKWEAQEAKKPPEQRRPLPTEPEVKPGMDLAAYNELALKKWDEDVCVPGSARQQKTSEFGLKSRRS